ncbi:MAG TPA: hypothetical protein VJ385_03625 [Fibrobacteria bacterium]|nr:hypothetical protein [Fibrobacteria bacterium]
MIDDFLPRFSANESHHTLIQAPSAAIYPVVRRLDLGHSLFQPLFGAGTAIASALSHKPRATRTLGLDAFLDFGFMLLGENGRDEIVLGLVQKVGLGDRNPRLKPEQFKAYETEGYFKAAWNFHLAEAAGGKTRLTTETRVQCYGTATTRIFMAYWLLIKPMSGLTRMEMLRALRKASEAA